MTPRIAIGSLMQETNTFVPSRTTVETFERLYLRRGPDLFTAFANARVEITAFLDTIHAANATPIPLLAGHAGSSGPLRRPDFDRLVDELTTRLNQAAPVDGVLLALHGAMVVEDAPDAEAEIVARIRTAVPAGTPIGVSLDLHGHITAAMLQSGVFFIGYREYPHIDLYETGERVARLLLDTIAGRRRPVMALAKRHMLVSPVAAITTAGPLAALMAQARHVETGPILHASLFPVQPWLDLPDLGFAALVCADADAPAAQAAANHLAERAWNAKHLFTPALTPLPEAIATALTSPGLASPGLTVVGDPGDAPSSGAAADHAGVLRALLEAGAHDHPRLTYLTLCDAEAARAAAAAGIGATVSLTLGHSQTRDGDPVTIQGTVRTLTDGAFTMHDAGAQGSIMAFGLTAVVAIGSLRLALRSLPGYEWDTGTYTSAGLDLRDAALVFVKSPSHFRVSYGPHAARILTADTPGASCANMQRLRFQNVTRPLWPLDGDGA